MFLNRIHAISLAFVVLLTTGTVRASDAGVLFQQGVDHGERGEWEEAAALFEEALAIEDRPSLRFNLVLAYVELGRAPDVVRHAIAFLDLPPEPHRADARTRVEQALRDAQAALATPDVRDDLQVDPGELSEAAVGPPVEGSKGAPSRSQVPATSRRVSNLPALQLSLAAHESRIRKRLAWSLGVAGTLGLSMGLASYVAAARAADRMGDSDPFTSGSGFFSSYDNYQSWQRCILPFAIVGASLTSAAIVVGDRSTRQTSSAWAWGTLAAGAALVASGAVLTLRTPEVIANSRIDGPSRQGGAILLSAALPLLTYAVTYAVRRRHEDRAPMSIARSQVRW